MANTHSLDLEAGSSQFAQIADGSQTGLDLSGDFSIEAWIKLEEMVSVHGTNMVIVSKYEGGGNDKRSYLFYANTSDKLALNVSSDGTTDNGQYLVINADTALPASTGVWIHVAVTFDISTETCTFYVDGKSDSSTVASGTGVGATIYNGDTPFGIGALVNETAWYFDGLVDDVRVWSDIRTASEIETNFHKELVGDEAGLVGYWKLNNDYTDETSNSNDLTSSGSPVFSTDIAFTETNTYSLDLESGSSQYAKITDANQTGLDITGDITVEAWVKAESTSATMVIASKIGSSSQIAWKWQVNSANTVEFYYSQDGGFVNWTRIITDSAQVVDGTWVHLAFAVDVSDQSAVTYVDGSSVANTTSVSSATSIFDSSGAFMVGAEDEGTPANFYDGLVDEVRVWKFHNWTDADAIVDKHSPFSMKSNAYYPCEYPFSSIRVLLF